MMRLKLALISLPLLLLSAAPAAAQCDCASIGLYFDAGATSNCVDVLPPFTYATIYVVHAYPYLEEFNGFELGITIDGGNLQTVNNENLFGSTSQSLDLQAVHIESAEPRPLVDFTVLMTLQFLNASEMPEPVRFYLHASRDGSKSENDEPVLLLGEGAYQPMPVNELGSEPGLSALIAGFVDGCAPVANSEQSWGAVKSLYR